VAPAADPSLRVSVAALARVLVDDPAGGQTLLVLERAATLEQREGAPQVVVRAKPYGGGVRLRDAAALRAAIGEFQFDSVRSKEEADFRILIRETDWPKVLEFCQRHLQPDEDGPLETGPERELAEELEDALKLGALPTEPWTLAPLGVVVEAQPAPTASPRAPGARTVRIYSIYEARLRAPALIAAVLASSAAFAGDEELGRLAWEDARAGGRGRANATLALPLEPLVAAYRQIPVEQRGGPVRIGGRLLDGNVPAILPEVETSKYCWLLAQRPLRLAED
jgi:hypothetical protein